MNPAVGIDLGTTNTVIAIQTEDFAPRILKVRQPVEARTQYEERPEIKSAVLFESPTSVIVGHYAASRPDGIRSIKSRMGTRWRVRNHQQGGPSPNRGRPAFLTPAYVSAHILKLAFDTIVAEYPQWDRKAVVTVPAAFNTDQREDTVTAAKYAGFQHVELLDEPTAAFYTYFDQFRESDEFAEPRTVLVFDFGGGTLDVSIIRVNPLAGGVNIDAIGRSRFNDLGGDDIDLDLAVTMLALWEKESGRKVDELPDETRKRVYRVFIRAASAYKERTEERITHSMTPDDFFLRETITDGKTSIDVTMSVTLSRAQYDLIAGQFLDNKREVNIYRPIEQALALASEIDPSFDKTTIDLVLYTGGSSQMNGVKAAIGAYFAPITCDPVGDDGVACSTVAIGAASYRYDQMHRKEAVKMSTRTLEAILTRPSPASEYTVLVPVTACQSAEYQQIEYRFTLTDDQVCVRIPLFRGTGPRDHELSPIRDVVLRLPHMVREGTTFQLSYRVTADKTIDLRAIFETDEPMDAVEGSAPLDEDEHDATSVWTLYPINRKGE